MAGCHTLRLSPAELREVTGFAVACAEPALAIMDDQRPGDRRPMAAINAARAFANGGERTKEIRDGAWAAMRASHDAREAGYAAAAEAARAAMAAAGAAFLHPLARATQVKHILGSAAHAARAFELFAADDRAIGGHHIAEAKRRASAILVDVLRRYPPAPLGGGRVRELIRELDASLR